MRICRWAHSYLHLNHLCSHPSARWPAKHGVWSRGVGVEEWFRSHKNFVEKLPVPNKKDFGEGRPPCFRKVDEMRETIAHE